MKRPWIIGHRGAMGHAPENTLASFELGWKMGADALECDVHLSQDGRLVVIHDASLERTTSGSGLVRRTPWAGLRRLDAGSWYHKKFRGQRLWRLQDLLRWMRGKKTRAGAPLRLVLEIKNPKPGAPRIADAAVKALRRGGFIGRTTLISFDHAVVRRAKALCPGLSAGILFHKALPGLEARVRWAGADAVFPRRTLVKPSLLRLARRRGWFVGTWTVNEAPEMRRMVRLGVDAAATNHPGRFAEILRKSKVR